MEKIKVLVADSQKVVRQQLMNCLRKDEQIEIIGAVDNGEEAYELFVSDKPNIVVFDLLMPVYDGYSLLQKMNKHGVDISTKLIMTTPLTSDLLISEAFCQGVDYIILKPYDAKMAADKIKRVYMRMNEIIREGTIISNKVLEPDFTLKKEDKSVAYIETLISDKLNEIGIPARLKGYRYMITAVKEVIKNEGALEGVTKILYPDVAKKHNSTPQRVEKAIRHAIEVAWSVDDQSNIKQEFSYIISTGKERPTNSEFIAKVSRDIRQSA